LLIGGDECEDNYIWILLLLLLIVN
jgi:hypothetical protein